MKKYTQEDFIEKCKKIHNNKYDYSLVKYVNSKTKVKIICPIHGEFDQLPNNHSVGKGCKDCNSLKKLTIEEIIKRGNHIHNNKYDYSKVKYINNRTKVKIFCKEHNGYFFQTIGNHLSGQRCPKCYGNIRKKTEEFIKNAKIVHDNNYSYNEVNYINNRTKVKIFCKEHNGYFYQRPYDHLNGVKCGECYKNLKSNIDEFIKKAKNIHGNIYDYTESKYVNAHTKVKIICKKHGCFYQTPNSHLRGSKCSKCSGIFKFTVNNFIERAINKHGKKYDYSKVKYKNTHNKVKIICPIHGVFEQNINNHINGQGCPKCGGSKRLTTEEFIKKSNHIHNEKYKYDKVEYVNAHTKVKIICEEHGIFSQSPNAHLVGCGCPSCTNEYKGERIIRILLEKNKIDFNTQHKFKECKYKKELRFDFYIKNKKLAIEYDGRQHYQLVKLFGGENGFKKRKKLDAIKNKYCKDNNIKLLRIPYTEFKNIKQILKDNNII